LAWAAALGLDPLSPRLTGALAKNGVVDLGTGRLRTYSWPVMAITSVGANARTHGLL